MTTIHTTTLRSLLQGLRAGSTAAELQAASGRTRSALYRDLAALRALGVELAPRSRRAGGDPPFRVLDWGPFNPDRL
jgi:predicted DNA-binding transcriptional regulator YafY